MIIFDLLDEWGKMSDEWVKTIDECREVLFNVLIMSELQGSIRTCACFLLPFDVEGVGLGLYSASLRVFNRKMRPYHHLHQRFVLRFSISAHN